MEIITKRFNELSTEELYSVLRLRAEVFVVEQACPYQDLDNNDKIAVHVFAMEDGDCFGCLRVFRKEDGNATIGRVVTSGKARGTGLGLRLMREGIKLCRELFGSTSIVIHAQSYACGFYEKCGFRVSSDEFLEDDIPHREMTL